MNGCDLLILGFPDGSVVKNLPVKVGDMGLIRGWEDTLEKEMATHFTVLLPAKSHGQRSLVAIIHGVTKELNMTWQLKITTICSFNTQGLDLL